MASEAIRVAIVDDDRVLSEALRALIDSAAGFVCLGVCGSVEEAVAALRDSKPDVILLDIQLPGMQGHEAVRLLRAICPRAEILMLTVFSERERVFTSICNGATGYLLKTTPPAKILEAIRSSTQGGSPISPEIARQVLEAFRIKSTKVEPSGELSPQELRLLSLLSEGYSYTTAGAQMGISVNTVRNYVRSVYDKLHVHSKSEAVGKALREGLLS